METLNTAALVGFSRIKWSSRHSVSRTTSSTDFKIDSPTMTTVHAEADDTSVVPDPQQKGADLYSLSAYTEDLLSSRMNIYSHTTTGTWNESLGLDDEIRFATPKLKSFHQHPAITHSGGR
jgi:hypothetical protein